VNWNAIGAIAEALGALGVISSLLYLAYQIKGDREATQANTTQMRATAQREMGLAVATSEHLAPILAKVAPEAHELQPYFGGVLGLTDEQSVRLASYWFVMLRAHDAAWRMPMNESERQYTLESALQLVNGPAGPLWDVAKGMFPKDFSEEIERGRT